MNKNIKAIEKILGVVPNFPKKGISFKDITPIFAKPKIFDVTIKEMLETIKGRKFDVVVGLESRGFWFALPIAQALKLPFVPIRKKGKLPRPTVSTTYKLEYGSDTIQVHKQDIKPKDRVLIVDDIVATGGTILATKKLLEQLKVKYCELLVLGALTSECPEGIKRLRKAGIKINYLLDL